MSTDGQKVKTSVTKQKESILSLINLIPFEKNPKHTKMQGLFASVTLKSFIICDFSILFLAPNYYSVRKYHIRRLDMNVKTLSSAILECRILNCGKGERR